MSEPRNPELDAAEIAKIEAEIAVLECQRSLNEGMINDTEYRRRKDRAANEANYVYHFHFGVDDSSVPKAIEELSKWSRMSPGEPIRIVFTSPGGGVLNGFALYDFIQSLRRAGHEVTTENLGFAASMGGILLQAGDKRVASKHSWMLIHEVSTLIAGKSSDLADNQKFIDRLEAKVLGILSERSNMTPKQIKLRWKKSDWWLDADEMLNLGFVDEVI